MSNPLIRKLGQLHRLSDAETAVLEDLAGRPARIVEPRHDFVRDGDRPTECNLILEGFACRYKVMPDGKRQIMAFQIAGDIADLQSMLLRRMDHSLGALTRCRIVPIPHKVLLDISERFPALTRALWRDTLIDAAIFREWMASIGRRSAYQRIAHLMCEVATKLEAVGLARDGTYPWPITQAEVGDALGLSTVHVNRTLQELRGDSLVTLRGNTLVINDPEGLQRAGDFTPEYLHLEPVADGAAMPPLADAATQARDSASRPAPGP